MQELSEADYIVDKLAGRLRPKEFRILPDHPWQPIAYKQYHSVNEILNAMSDPRVETRDEEIFEEWKARKEAE